MENQNTENQDTVTQNTTKPDIKQLMSEIRSQIANELKDNSFKPRLSRQSVGQFSQGSVAAILYSDELNYLNANWGNWSPVEEIKSHRKFIGPIIVGFKKFVAKFLFNNLLKSYFSREHDFQMNMVRFLNKNARYIDARDSEIFWQIIQKIDNDIKSVNQRTDVLFDELYAVVETLKVQLGNSAQ